MDEELRLGPKAARELVLEQLGEWESEVHRSPGRVKKAYHSLRPDLLSGLLEDEPADCPDEPDRSDLENQLRLEVAGAFLSAWHAAAGNDVAVRSTHARTVVALAMAGREPGATRMEMLDLRDEIAIHFEQAGIAGSNGKRRVAWWSRWIGALSRKPR